MGVVLLKRKTDFVSKLSSLGFSGVILFGTFFECCRFPAAADWQRLSRMHCLLLLQQSV